MNELRLQQNRLQLLHKYLPTLQLKKGLLQIEVNEARLEIEVLKRESQAQLQVVEAIYPLLTVDMRKGVEIQEVQRRFENIAGVEVPHFEGVIFKPFEYRLIETPPWFEGAIFQMRKLEIAQEKVRVSEEKKGALEKELREVSIRVNLFEKVLIPRASEKIRKMKVSLQDQMLAAVSRAKVAKRKLGIQR